MSVKSNYDDFEEWDLVKSELFFELYSNFLKINCVLKRKFKNLDFLGSTIFILTFVAFLTFHHESYKNVNFECILTEKGW